MSSEIRSLQIKEGETDSFYLNLFCLFFLVVIDGLLALLPALILGDQEKKTQIFYLAKLKVLKLSVQQIN